MEQFELKQKVVHHLEIKKSQFITWLVPVTDKQQAKDYVQQAKLEFPDARHHCWAYVMGYGNSLTAAMSDDGEPSGTAGKPILNVLQHKPVCNVMAIVIRYFGGIKLGAGGLVRAYSQATELAFQDAELIAIEPQSQGQTQVSFADEQWLRHILDGMSGTIIDTQYHEQVSLTFTLADKHLAELTEKLTSQGYPLKWSKY